jgi:glycerol-3-phosphate dehydrogenase subunit B
MHDVDVLVLGGGIAGAAAALSAAARGARVVLARSGPGATAVCAGGWIGQPPAPLRAALAESGLPLHDCATPLPHPDGRLVTYEAAPAAHVQAALGSGAERVLVCGIAGLPAFRPAALAALWTESAQLAGHALDPATITLPGTPAAGWSSVALAAHVERDPGWLAAPLARAIRERGAARVIVPAVLGIDAHAEVHAAVSTATGVTVGEALGVPPSLPGWRVDRALLRALAGAGVTVVAGMVTEHVAREKRVQLVTVADQGGATAIRAAGVVLATGKFLGGGVSAHARFIDTALGTELHIERAGQSWTDAADSLALTDAVRAGSQPLLTVGVRANEAGQPVTPAGDVIFRNVVVAGSVRAGTEAASLGLGNAASDGWEAGARAARIAALS